MTDFIPLIVEDNGDGTGDVRRAAASEAAALSRWMLQWLSENSLLVKRDNGVVASEVISANQLFGRLGGNSLRGLSPAEVFQVLGLDAALNGKANTVHAHQFIQGISDIDWATLGDGRILARENGQFVWIDTPTGGTGGSTGGGTGGVSNPLGENLDLNGNALMSGDTELLQVQNGKVYFLGKEVFEFDTVGAQGGFVPRYNGNTNRYEGARPRTFDLVGDTEGSYLVVGPDGFVIETEGPGGGTTSGGDSTPASGSSYPAGPTSQSSFLRTDLVRGYVYRDDLPIKNADSDADTISGWVATSERSIAVRRTDLDLNRDPGYIVGDGFNAGIYFPEAAVIRRLNMTVGANTSGDVQYRIKPHPSNGEGVSVRAIAIGGPADTDEPWIRIPANSFLSLYGENWTFATREINLELIVSDFRIDDTSPQPA